jgi:DNA polymerase II large subunit
MNESKNMELYFSNLNLELANCLEVATKARAKGKDPEDKVDIPLASDMAERVQGLISSIAPDLVKTNMAKRIKELEKKYPPQSWEIALLIAEEVAKDKFLKFPTLKDSIEMGIRVGMAYSTAGIVAAPLEGLVEVKIKKRKDGKDYLALYYAGPIRGAGGTAAAVSVLIADYVRLKLGLDKYDPTEDEVKRYVREISDYHERITNLQYFPSEEEIIYLAQNLPVEISGDPTEKIEVSNFKDLSRVETNLIRGGMCLVLAEGVAQKSPKLWKRISKWNETLGIDWTFLEAFLEIQKKIKAKEEPLQKKEKISPNYTYIADLVAGRPVLAYPLRTGGFRLRYGRTRTSGYSAAAVNPATMWVLNSYIAVGTQLKVERPGKAAAITCCDEIEGPIVKLLNGNVLKINTEEEAKKYKNEIEKILYLGDILFNYGDFSENNHVLVPCGYCPEWWVLELEKATVEMFGTLDMDKLSDFIDISSEKLENIIKEPLSTKLSFNYAVNLSLKMNIPLHPDFIYFWRLLDKNELLKLIFYLEKGNKNYQGNKLIKIIFKFNIEFKEILEKLGVPHLVLNKEFIVIQSIEAQALLFTLNMNRTDYVKNEIKNKDLETLDLLSFISGVKIKDKIGTFIGARMGRPEKAKMRKLTGSPHVLFPVGEEGGRFKSFQSAVSQDKVKAQFPIYHCSKCKKELIFPFCEECKIKTKKMYYCRDQGLTEKEVCNDRSKAYSYRTKEIDINYYFSEAIKSLDLKAYPDVIKGVRGTVNKDHIPEQLAKGILRAKHGINVNKDGTTRYDMTELPITHFTPKEIHVSIDKLKKLGYVNDIHGRVLENENQVLEIFPQDLILPCSENALEDSADKVLFNVANFIDELLVKFYGLKPYYNLNEPNDLIGHLVIGLAPHISAGTIARIIGFSETQGCFAHPLYHAALRRDCDGDENCVMMLMDAFLNFSRQFLPDRRGSRTMDSPLVLTSKLVPSEVDDMAHGLDIVWNYPLDFYYAAENYKYPWEIKIEQIKHRLDTYKQYEEMGYTHKISNINKGVLISSYKILPTMEEKLKGQMDLAEKINAVEASDVASAVITKHFLKDIRGNMRKFSQQQFRCVACNEKFRRPPLLGKCTKCEGKIIFTISEGSVGKYLEPSLSLAKKYNVSPYLLQTLELTKRNFEALFGKEKEKQTGLGEWFG